MTPLFDLHSHTNMSDGGLSPTELIERASREGVTTLAVTDHDTVEGIEEALSAGARLGVEVIPGVEVSAYFGDTAIHLLGLFVEHRETWLHRFFDELKQARVDRIHTIVERLRALDLDIEVAQVMACSTHGTVGRPHVAKALVQIGAVKNFQQAFDLYLHDGGPAHVGYKRVDFGEALALVHRAGGVSSLAHPVVMKDDSLIAPMAEQGLMALEVFHVDHSATKIADYREAAETLGLLVTGGSDFHEIGGAGRNRLGCRELNEEHMDSIRSAAASTRG